MKMSKITRAAVFGAALFGAGAACAADLGADSTLRQLAEARGRYVGSILNSEWFNNGFGGDAAVYEDTHKSQFNIVVAENEMKFDATEPSRDQFNYKKADKLIAYAAANGMQVRGHALAWHSQVPGWVSQLAEQVKSAGGSPRDTLLAVLKNHIYNVVGNYKGKIREWDVVNEAIEDGSPAAWRGADKSVWYKYIGRDFIDSAFTWAHEADPDAKLYYNDYSLEWGVGNGSKAKFALDSIAQRLKDAGIYITGIGTQTHIENVHTSTPANVKQLAKKLQAMGLTLQITELDIGFAMGKTPTAADYAEQGHLYRQFMDLFLESPNMEALVIWGFSDKYSWLKDQGKKNGLIFDSSFVKKPAYDSLVASLKAHDASTVTPAGSGSVIEVDPGVPTFGKGTYVIVDYSKAGAEARGSWSSDVKAGEPSFVATEFAGKAGYMNVPLAGCDQSEETCGYQHAIYTLPEDVVKANVLTACENLVVTMYGPSGTAYVNVGFNEPWTSLEYGRPASGTEWSESSVDLEAVRENAAEPTQLTFNSNSAGIYLAKIEAVGCPDGWAGPDAIPGVVAQKGLNAVMAGRTLNVIGAANVRVDVLDMQGRPVVSVSDVNGALNLESLANGMYVVRIQSGSQKFIGSITVK